MAFGMFLKRVYTCIIIRDNKRSSSGRAVNRPPAVERGDVVIENRPKSRPGRTNVIFARRTPAERFSSGAARSPAISAQQKRRTTVKRNDYYYDGTRRHPAPNANRRTRALPTKPKTRRAPLSDTRAAPSSCGVNIPEHERANVAVFAPKRAPRTAGLYCIRADGKHTTRTLLGRVFDFLGDVVEVVPTVVRPQARVKRGGHVAHAASGVFEIVPEVFGTPLEYLAHATGDDHDDGDEFRGRESVLHAGGQVHAVAVYVRDDHCQ